MASTYPLYHKTSDVIAGCYQALETLAQELAGLPEPAIGARSALDRVYRQLIPRWHFSMLNRPDRAALYRRALEAAGVKDKVVLDIGTGSGLLAMMSARLGARRVISCEAIGPIAEVAVRIVEQNGYADRVKVVHATSYDPKVAAELPRGGADVIVTETVDQGMVGENILETLGHARRYLLKPGGVILPCRGTIWGRLIESMAIHKLNYVKTTEGFDVSLFNKFSSVGHFPCRVAAWPHKFVSDPFVMFDFDFAAGDLSVRTESLRISITDDGAIHACMIWFELDIFGGIRWSNLSSMSPVDQAGNIFWYPAVSTFEVPLEARAGSALEFDMSCADERISVYRGRRSDP